MHDRLYENPNFVWLDKDAIVELLKRRQPRLSDAMTIYNNLLRWALYQMDRTACSEIDGKMGAEIDIIHRLNWIKDCRMGSHQNVTQKEMNKYLKRALALMPWEEMSQKDFLQFVVPYEVLSDEDLLKQSINVMDVVVKNPDRLHHSAFSSEVEAALAKSRRASPMNSPVSTYTKGRENGKAFQQIDFPENSSKILV